MSATDPPRKPTGPSAKGGGQVALGVALTLALHVAAGIVLAMVGGVLSGMEIGDAGGVVLLPLLVIGAAQLVYMLPAWIIARRRGRNALALGLVVGFSLTLLANSACFGVLIYGL